MPVPRGIACISIYIGLLLCGAAWSGRGWSQEIDRPGGAGGVSSYGISTSYSPNSSHIFIGEAYQRRTWTQGLEYTRLLHLGQRYRLDYEGAVTPFWLESDPTLTGSVYTINGKSVVTPQAPIRVDSIDHQPLGYVVANWPLVTSVPLYAVYGRENTYAASLAPVGMRVSTVSRWPVVPSFAIDLGFVVSSRDIPVDLADQFNYMFALGPGVQVYTSPRASVRLDYLYRHISNAHQGYQNPGVDQGVFRLTLSRRR
jgi:hypothetical protein